ncbi:hypothetical protein O181_114970 [Austropuccinia psidii MF-1]|uniref:Response regulatory domain-containing protein n=1 Tax=Austropuccinia psidii MF-1 TaxID=1389203 RepID=A0A9Q3PW08_9BASI|nr:hypothetical protein [Austropuccinia psidii MF-1]
METQPASAFISAGVLGISNRLSSPECTSSPYLISIAKPGSTPLDFTIEETTNVWGISDSKSEPITIRSESQPIHVLVVEDNFIDAKRTRQNLIQKGYIVSMAADGRKALDLIYADNNQTSVLAPIDVVLMDIQMPIMDGIQAITELRESEKNGKINKHYPVIAVTADTQKEQIDQCLSSGFDNIYLKPYKIEEIQIEIENLIN